MDDEASWRTLRLGATAVRLLIRSKFGPDGYEIHITDLCNIWGETLSRNEIAKQASTAGCSIEPSEDDQYGILLAKIQSALKGEAETSLAMRASADGQSLNIDMTASLPPPLPIFEWTLRLARTDGAAIVSWLVPPLLCQANRLHSQIQSLLEEIQAKDRIISKITDRLESSGNDLTAVFPGVSNIKVSRRKAQREQLARHVRGLANFDLTDWKNQLPSDRDSTKLSDTVLDKILNDMPQADSDEITLRGNERWWQCLNNTISSQNAPLRPAAKPKVHAEHSGQESARTNSMQSPHSAWSDDEFQRQETPPHLKDHEARQDLTEKKAGTDDVAQADSDTSTVVDDDDDDNDNRDDENQDSVAVVRDDRGHIERSTSMHNPQSASSQPQHSRFGKAGNPDRPQKLATLNSTCEHAPQSSADSELESRQSPEPMRKLGTFGGKQSMSLRAKTPPGSTGGQTESQSRTKLGTLGGKAKIKTHKPPERQVESPPHGTTRPENKLETTPRSSVAQDSSVLDNRHYMKSDHSSKTPNTHQNVVSDGEDAEERANNKRARLRHELEEKAKIPVKKKRRF